MLNKEKCFCIIEFLGKKTNKKNWSKKFFLHGKQKGYKKLLVTSGSTSGMGKIPSQDKYENACLARNVKSADFPKRNCKIVWYRLVRKYALHTASSLLKLKSKFHNSKLESMEKTPMGFQIWKGCKFEWTNLD